VASHTGAPCVNQPVIGLLGGSQERGDQAIVKAILVNAVRAIMQYKGVAAEIWTDPVVEAAVVPVMGLLGITRIQADGIVATGIAIAYRLWYTNIDSAVRAFGGKRRTIIKRSGYLTRVLTQLGADAELSPESTMRALVSEASDLASSVGGACDGDEHDHPVTGALTGGWQ
jgi:hypothetical protein